MTVTEAIEKIKVLLSEAPEMQTEEVASEPATEFAFETYDLKDGSKIDLSALEIGAEAMLVDESGNAVAAPSGEYELADGTMISVMDGKVEGIESPMAESPEVEEAVEMAEEPNQFEEMNATIGYLQAENEALKAKLTEIEGKFEQGFSEVIGALEALATLPSADPIQAPKQAFKVTESKADKVDRFLNKFVK
jgi:soluble cytochrome b562